MIRRLIAPAFAVLFVLSLLPAEASPTQPLAGRKVALDPGHGESATEVGAVNTVNGVTLLERDVNWDVVVATRDKLTTLGASVLITRAQTEFVDRPTRYARAKSFGAEVLVSVHHNGSSDATINYTTSFYTQPSDRTIARLAQQQLVQQLHFADGGVRHSAFGMTVKPKMPSTLTEAWFLTNDALAAQWIQNPSSLREAESTALTNAVAQFLTTSVVQRH